MTPEHRETIDNTLLAIYDRTLKLAEALGINIPQPSLEALQQCSLAQDLEFIANFVEGIGPGTEVQEVIHRVMRTFLRFSPYHKRSDFHKTSLGGLINTARLKAIWSGDGMTPTQVAQELGITRQTVYEWIEQGKFNPLWINNHPVILPPEVMRLRSQ